MSANFGPTTSWPVLWRCDIATYSPTALNAALSLATLVLWAMTGRQYGTTQVKVRPCRRECRSTPFPGYWADPWPGSGWSSIGVNSAGGWGALIAAGCSQCGDSCSCQSLSEIMLPAPVNAVVEVRTDGAVLASGSYRLDDNRVLLRTDGSTWPWCQNLRLADTQPGTFSVTATYGQDVPDGAALAVGELACEYLRALDGEDCRLPRGLTSLARQGVTISLPDLTTALHDKGMLALPMVDQFIRATNPYGLSAAAKVYPMDGPRHRRTG